MSILFKELEDLQQKLSVANGDAAYWRRQYNETELNRIELEAIARRRAEEMNRKIVEKVVLTRERDEARAKGDALKRELDGAVEYHERCEKLIDGALGNEKRDYGKHRYADYAVDIQRIIHERDEARKERDEAKRKLENVYAENYEWRNRYAKAVAERDENFRTGLRSMEQLKEAEKESQRLRGQVVDLHAELNELRPKTATWSATNNASAEIELFSGAISKLVSNKPLHLVSHELYAKVIAERDEAIATHRDYKQTSDKDYVKVLERAYRAELKNIRWKAAMRKVVKQFRFWMTEAKALEKRFFDDKDTEALREMNARLQSSIEVANAEVERLRGFQTIIGMMKLSQLIELTSRRGYYVDIHLKPNNANLPKQH